MKFSPEVKTPISKGMQMFLRGMVREMSFAIDFCSTHGFRTVDLSIEIARSAQSAMDFLLWRNKECMHADELFLAGEKIESLLSGALFLHHRVPYDGLRINYDAFKVYAASFSHLFLLETMRGEILIPADEQRAVTVAEEMYAAVNGGVARMILRENGNKIIKGFIVVPPRNSPYVHSPHLTPQ